MAAIHTAPIPAQIFVEEPALHYYNELKQQSELMTAGNGDLELEPGSPAGVQNLLRVIQAHHLLVTPNLKHLLQHGLSTARINNIISTERTNKFGPQSWCRRAIMGKASSIDVQVLKTKYSLMVKYHQIAPNGVESPANRVRRHINKTTLQQALADLDAQWTQTYREARDHAAKARARKETTAEGEEWRRRYTHYNHLIAHPPHV